VFAHGPTQLGSCATPRSTRVRAFTRAATCHVAARATPRRVCVAAALIHSCCMLRSTSGRVRSGDATTSMQAHANFDSDWCEFDRCG
jgi:hypothetical protein